MIKNTKGNGSSVSKDSIKNATSKQHKEGTSKEQLATTKKQLRDDMLVQLERFVEYHPARRFGQNLRSLLLEFLMYDGSAEAEYLRDLAIDLTGLFDLLDAIELVQGVGYGAEEHE